MAIVNYNFKPEVVNRRLTLIMEYVGV